MPLVSIGGISFQLDADHGGEVPAFLSKYSIEAAEPMVRFTGRLGEVGHLLDGETLFDSGGVWRIDRGPRGPRLVLRTGGVAGIPYHVLEMDDDFTSGEATIDPGILGEESPFVLRDPLLEIWYSFVLMRGRGLLVHGLGVLIDDFVHLFLGESGAGKSTLGHVFDDEGVGTILSDDRIVLRPDGESFRAYGTPWHGEEQFSSPRSGPVASISLLSQSLVSRLEPVSPDAAALGILKCCFMAGWPRSDSANVLATCADVACRVSCGTLHFTPDRTALAAAGLGTNS